MTRRWREGVAPHGGVQGLAQPSGPPRGDGASRVGSERGVRASREGLRGVAARDCLSSRSRSASRPWCAGTFRRLPRRMWRTPGLGTCGAPGAGPHEPLHVVTYVATAVVKLPEAIQSFDVIFYDGCSMHFPSFAYVSTFSMRWFCASTVPAPTA